MPSNNIEGAKVSDLTNAVSDIVVASKEVDSPQDQDETEYTNSKWTQWFGYYKQIPEVKTAIDMRAIWTIGKGYEAEDSETKVILDHVSGWGKETFDSILKNLMICKRIGGDAFAEIMRDEKGLLINLKALHRNINSFCY